jgi:hypothetical protein
MMWFAHKVAALFAWGQPVLVVVVDSVEVSATIMPEELSVEKICNNNEMFLFFPRETWFFLKCV